MKYDWGFIKEKAVFEDETEALILSICSADSKTTITVAVSRETIAELAAIMFVETENKRIKNGA